VSYDVLFVDDEPENLVVFEAACGERFRVTTAGSAAAALEILRSAEVGVLLSDQRMPEMTGLELLELAQKEFPRTIRMLTTAYSDLPTAIGAINRGQVRRYLCKPWDSDELCSALAEGVDYYQMSSKLCALERRLREAERVYALGTITAGLAGELRRPLAAMQTSIKRVREIVRGVAVAIAAEARGAPLLRAQLFEADEDLGEALVAAGRLLDVARGVEIPTASSEEEYSDLTDVLRLSLRLMQAEIRASASLELDVRTVPEVVGSTTQLGQVVLNLLVSAVHAMAEQPRERNTLAIRVVRDETWVVLEVADTGPGIEKSALSQIFDPFFVSGRPPGASLGLAISKTILDQIGGNISAESRAGEGAVFRVRLRARP
jgi:two-component system, NtrC family, sensor kinase